MKIKYLGLKVAIILTTIMATPLVWAALAYPEWQANADIAAESGQVEAEQPPAVPPVERRIVIVPRLVYTQSAPTTAAPALPQQPVAAAPPPQAAPGPRAAPAPPARSATTRGS